MGGVAQLQQNGSLINAYVDFGTARSYTIGRNLGTVMCLDNQVCP